MGRKRAPGNNEWMPAVYSFALLVTTGKPGGSTENIAPADATKVEVWVAYEKKLSGRNRITFTQLWRKFLASAAMLIWPQERRKKDYLAHEKYILAVFGDAEVKAIKPEHPALYGCPWAKAKSPRES